MPFTVPCFPVCHHAHAATADNSVYQDAWQLVINLLPYNLLLCCSCLRKFGSSTQQFWLWADVMSDLLFLSDLLLLLLSAYYTDRTANAFIASQSAANAEAQHNPGPAADQLITTQDVRRASLSLGPDARRQSLGAVPQLDSLGTGPRVLAKSLSRSKRDMTLQAGLQLYRPASLPVCAVDCNRSACNSQCLHPSIHKARAINICLAPIGTNSAVADGI